jgi:hypothetical protein
MSRMTRVGLLAGAAALTVTGVSVASPAVEGNDDALRAEIQRLSSRLADLEGRNGNNWLNEQRADEIRGIVHDVLADADTRASLLGSGMTSGYDPDKGFQIGSADGNFQLNIQGQLQVRWLYNYRSGGGTFGDRHRSGFENTRTKITLGGHVVNPQWTYRIEADFGSTGAGTLQDAYIGYDCGNGLSFRAGQMKLPFMAESLIDSRYQQAIERSLFSTLFSSSVHPDGSFRSNRAQGIAATYEQDMFRVTGMWSDGAGGFAGFGGTIAGSDNTPWFAFSSEWALTGRAEILFAGSWDQFNDFRSMPGEETGILFGAAVHWQHSEYGVFGTTKTESVAITGDINAKFGGFNLFASIAWAHNDIKAPGAGSMDPWGFTVQGGYNFTDEWEGYLRYEWADFDMAGVSDLSILTWGINHYFAGHQAKLSADMGYSFNTLAFGNTVTGWVPDAGTDDGQFLIRTQLQLLF